MALWEGEMSPDWTRSTFCSDSTCVEVAILDDVVLLRDGKDVERPFLCFSKPEWTEFLNRIKQGHVSIPQ
jgi:hypothetical protein